MNDSTLENSNSGSFVPGSKLGDSPWITVDQQMISQFGEATRDADRMHIDPQWSKENSPYGGTIAFGFLTASLLTHMLHGVLGTSSAWDTAGGGYFMNYGMDYLRFVHPVPVDSRIRGCFETLENRFDEKERNIITFGCEIEIEGEKRPALIAKWLAILMPNEKR